MKKKRRRVNGAVFFDQSKGMRVFSFLRNDYRRALVGEPGDKVRLSARPVSTGQLNALLRLHLRPINLVVFQGPNITRIVENSSWRRLHA